MSHPDKGSLSVSQAGADRRQVLLYGPSTGQGFLECASVKGYCRLKADVTGWGRSPASVIAGIHTAEVSQVCAGVEQM